MVFISILFFFYFLMLFLFSLFSHPVYYCGLLVINSFIGSMICYLIFSFSWYSLLFCLIYVGGVYILFIFVSVYSPNSSYIVYFQLNIFSLMFLAFILLISGCLVFYAVINLEFSSFLCTTFEGNFYVAMCLTLIFGFILLSMIMSVNLNFYR